MKFELLKRLDAGDPTALSSADLRELSAWIQDMMQESDDLRRIFADKGARHAKDIQERNDLRKAMIALFEMAGITEDLRVEIQYDQVAKYIQYTVGRAHKIMQENHDLYNKLSRLETEKNALKIQLAKLGFQAEIARVSKND